MNAPDTSRREAATAALAALVFVAAEVMLFGGSAVFTRPLWLDEIHTLLVAGRQDMVTSMRSLAAGADFNPPTLFLVYRAIGWLSAGLSEVTMRVVALTSVAATLPIVYRLLRDEFDPLPAAVGSLAVWAQSVVVSEAFDARFYGPWLFGAAAFSLAIRNAVEGRPSWTNRLMVFVSSAFVCTIHYFGVLSWAGAVLVAVWFAGETRRETLRQLLPALAGPTALVSCAPFYTGQRAALTTATWIPDLSFVGAVFLVGVALLTPPLGVGLIGWGASRLVERGTAEPAVRKTTRGFALGPALLLGQAVVPVSLALFSLVVQPAMQPRYSIAAALVAAPLVAVCIARSTVLFRTMIVLAIVASSVALVRGEGQRSRDRARVVRQDVDRVTRIAATESTVVVRRRHSLYPILLERPALAGHAVLFDGASVRPNDGFEVVERDVARVHLARFGFPRMVGVADLDSLGAFYFLELDSTRSPGSREFPGRRIDRIGDRMFRIERPCAGRGQELGDRSGGACRPTAAVLRNRVPQ